MKNAITTADRLQNLARARAAFIQARSDLRAADLIEYSASDPAALRDLAAAATSRAIERRERESAQFAPALRAHYFEDAAQETAADLLASVLGDPDRPDRPAWIDGDPVELADRETGESYPVERAALPLAYFAARSAGRALDRIMYRDGGRIVKLTAREARESYRNAAELAPLADLADLLKAEADADPTPERIAAARDARRAYCDASRAFASAAVVVETRKTVDPIAPGPEEALIQAERIERVFSEMKPGPRRENAARLARAFYAGAESLRDAARESAMEISVASRAWSSLRAAAAVILAEDGETRDLERLIDEDRARDLAKTRKRQSERAAQDARDLRQPRPAQDPDPATVESWSNAARATRPDRLRETARLTHSEYKAAADLARAVYHASAAK